MVQIYNLQKHISIMTVKVINRLIVWHTAPAINIFNTKFDIPIRYTMPEIVPTAMIPWNSRSWSFKAQSGIKSPPTLVTDSILDTCQYNKIISNVGIPLTGLTLPHFCACSTQGPGFPTPHDVIVCLVDISEIAASLFKFSFHNCILTCQLIYLLQFTHHVGLMWL